MLNLEALHNKLEQVNIPVVALTDTDGTYSSVQIEYDGSQTEQQMQEAQLILSNFETELQQIETVQANAKEQVKQIPAWASWTEQEVVDHIQNNVTDLASAKTVLVAMGRMLVALRNEQYPDLQQ